MSERRIRELTFYLDYVYDSETKDMIEDLLTLYSDSNEIINHAISVLHERHFGSISKKTPSPTYSKTFSGVDEKASKTVEELWMFIQEMKDKFPKIPTVPTIESSVAIKQNNQPHFSEEANEKILEKIDELGMKFSKIVSPVDRTDNNPITAEMSKEEVLQLIKRIDQLESKLTKAISQSRVPATSVGGSARRPMKDFGDAPKIGPAIAIEGKNTNPEDRPLLEDVLDTVIVSVENEKSD
ncbi:MAG: hypothetical protein JXA54_05760 [Candidatus Heimdallarchaeota archaeon]|nr:hypothetical protein [Candidatus Heimdallarchaeota archaeon]